MRAINEDDVKRLIRSEKRNWDLTQFPGVTEALNHVEGGLVGIRTMNQVVPRWISVEERLPERDKEVLCFFRYPDSTTVCQNVYYGNGHWLGEGSFVTHWMPLPQPPEEPA